MSQSLPLAKRWKPNSMISVKNNAGKNQMANNRIWLMTFAMPISRKWSGMGLFRSHLTNRSARTHKIPSPNIGMMYRLSFVVRKSPNFWFSILSVIPFRMKNTGRWNANANATKLLSLVPCANTTKIMAKNFATSMYSILLGFMADLYGGNLWKYRLFPWNAWIRIIISAYINRNAKTECPGIECGVCKLLIFQINVLGHFW